MVVVAKSWNHAPFEDVQIARIWTTSRKEGKKSASVNGSGADALAVFLTLIFPFTRILMTWNVP